jgi:hypothetical protein
MFLDSVNNTKLGPGQTGGGQLHARKRFLPATMTGVVCLIAIIGCQPAPGVLQEDRRLPMAFRSPARTFQTWVAASVARDRQAIEACYWKGMSSEELSAWMQENMRPQARAFFTSAKFVSARPVTLVEVNFSYRSGTGESGRGVMVLTRQGWKIQRW